MIQRALRIAAWSLILAIFIMRDAPIGFRPTLGFGPCRTISCIRRRRPALRDCVPSLDRPGSGAVSRSSRHLRTAATSCDRATWPSDRFRREVCRCRPWRTVRRLIERTSRAALCPGTSLALLDNLFTSSDLHRGVSSGIDAGARVAALRRQGKAQQTCSVSISLCAGPMVGAGLLGLALAFGGESVWWRRRKALAALTLTIFRLLQRPASRKVARPLALLNSGCRPGRRFLAR